MHQQFHIETQPLLREISVLCNPTHNLYCFQYTVKELLTYTIDHRIREFLCPAPVVNTEKFAGKYYMCAYNIACMSRTHTTHTPPPSHTHVPYREKIWQFATNLPKV